MNSRAAFGFASTVSPQSDAGGRAQGSDVFNLFSQAYARERKEMMSLTDYLDACKDDPSMYSSAAERMIAAIGEPKVVDTSKDQRLGRLFHNRTIKLYPSMAGFFGMEETIQRVVDSSSTPHRGSKSASRFCICSGRSAAASHRSLNVSSS